MTSHWNVNIQIKEVREPEPIRDDNGYPAKVNNGSLISQKIAMTERTVLDRLTLNVSADTESEAYDKVLKLLHTNAPVLAEPVSRSSIR